MSQTQHMIDLLPESMRARSQARLAASRNIGFALIAAGALIALGTHARLLRSSAERELEELRLAARELDQTATRADMVQARIDELRMEFDRYAAVETPVPIAGVIATITALMPESLSIDQIDINADQARRARRGRTSRVEADAALPRMLMAEISGFARDDRDITRYIDRLEACPPLADVSLDFSKPRLVRGVPAREFRLSFMIDFEQRYVVRTPGATEGEVAHVE